MKVIRDGDSAADRVDDQPLRAAVRKDFKVSAAYQRIALIAVIFWLMYEWGAGNEAFTPWLIARTISATSGATSILVTAAVGFTFTLIQQLMSGFTALVGFSIFERTTNSAWRRLRDRLGREPTGWRDLGLFSRTVLVFSLGTTAVVLIETVTSGTAGRRRHQGVVVQSATLCALAVGTIAGTAAGIALIGRNVESLSGTTDWIIRLLGNPLLWIGLVIIVLGIQYLQSKRHQRSTRPQPHPE